VRVEDQGSSKSGSADGRQPMNTDVVGSDRSAAGNSAIDGVPIPTTAGWLPPRGYHPIVSFAHVNPVSVSR